MNRRHQDWPERLALFIDARRDRPFAWGDNDCVLAAADWICSATGEDPAAGWRGKWDDARSAMFMLKQMGGIEAAVTAQLGRPHATVGLAGRGDIGLVRHEDRHTLGVVIDAGLACPANQGLVVLPISSVSIAWPV